jgi:hypothetical protein
MLRPIDIRWIHNGTQVFAIHNEFTIWQTVISKPNNPRPYSVYAQIEGEEVHLAAYATLNEAIDHINTEATL